MSYLQVQNAEGLVRDTTTNAIINVDDNAYRTHLARKAQIEARKQQINKQIEEIDYLKQEMSEIKQILLELLKGK